MKIVENIAALIKVKTIVTFVVVAIFAVLALRGSIDPKEASRIAEMVMIFYFGTQAEHRSKEEKIK